MARLIVYYDDSFEPLDWWIHIIDGAELTITSSTVNSQSYQFNGSHNLEKLAYFLVENVIKVDK